MDINAYLLNSVIDATTPPDESAADAQARREAIAEMFRGYDPADTMETMIACQCIKLHFLSNSAMRHANNTRLALDDLNRARSAAISTSKTMHQWVTKLERIKHRKEVRAAEALKAAQTTAAPAPSAVADPLAAKTPAAPVPNAPPTVPWTEDTPGRQPGRPDTAVLDDAPIGDPIPPSVRAPRPPSPGVSPGAAARPSAVEHEAMPA